MRGKPYYGVKKKYIKYRLPPEGNATIQQVFRVKATMGKNSYTAPAHLPRFSGRDSWKIDRYTQVYIRHLLLLCINASMCVVIRLESSLLELELWQSLPFQEFVNVGHVLHTTTPRKTSPIFMQSAFRTPGRV